MAGARPARLKLGAGYERAFEKLRGALRRKKLDKAARAFVADCSQHGLKFEAVVGCPGYFKYRVDLRWHVLLRRMEDDQGDYYLAVDIQHHDSYG